MSNTLVAYFSATGTTANAASALAEAAHADLYEIRPEIPYAAKDLDWKNPSSRSSKEMKGGTPYPALADTDADIKGHDTILLGFPIWWYKAPTIINKFLESYAFTGKTIILFATSGGSGFGGTIDALKGSAAGAAMKEGRILNGSLSNERLKEWLSAEGIA